MTTDRLTVARAWIAALSSVALVSLWGLVARTPYPGSTSQATTGENGAEPASIDPQLARLAQRERALRLRGRAVKRDHDLRWSAYRQAVRARDALVAAAEAAPSYVWSGSPSSSSSNAPSQSSQPQAETRSS